MDFQSLDLGVSLVDFEEAWTVQRERHADVVAGTREDTVLLVEHAPVYTAGRRTHLAERPVDATVVDVDRGGKITWHGPGQLVAYPIVRLPDPIDVVTYVRHLEQAVMDLCGDLGLETVRVEGRSGVWFPADRGRRERKVCASGVRVARGVTMHGLALNCDPDLTAFSAIVPCGIADADVTSLSQELGRRFSVLEAEPLLRARLETELATLRRSRPRTGDRREPAPTLA